ncbi:sensor histidine kinase [Mycolicibacterium palauense]|uniref:sensor histidine kinase n=1 Tax=Mycolicibacterium palauense TaxID=2034511 RepID=UPI001FE34342|nr:GAF domain-containing protein [Mycolicibacterium palauense]
MTALGFIGAEIAVVHLLKRIAPDNAFGALFLLGVLVVSAGWGFGLAVATSLASALAYVWFHAHEGSESLAPAVVVFLTLALLTNVLVGQARLRAAEAVQRRSEADLAAELARLMLRTADLDSALRGAGQRLAQVLEIPFAVLRLDDGTPGVDGHHCTTIPLRDATSPGGALLVPQDLAPAALQRVHRMLPSLEALLAAARDRQRISAELAASHAQTRALADQQSALRRVATLVARGAPPDEVYPAAVAEVAHGLDVHHVNLMRYCPQGCVIVASHDAERERRRPTGEVIPLDGDTVASRVRDRAQPSRIDDYGAAAGATAARLRRMGLRSGVGAPITVNGAVWGALIVDTESVEPLPRRTEDRVADFADLVATAVTNAETRAELTASRARIVAAADQARRGFERDLHDGAQQRIVSLGLELRALEAGLPEELPTLRAELAQIVDGLASLHSDLQELSRGIHPAILSRGGLGPAIKNLARRSAVPVLLELGDLGVQERLPEPVEVAAYYVIAEALTNAAKHARASEVRIDVHADRTGPTAGLYLRIADDGVGGAAAGHGSGLIGLKDRIEAQSGRLRIVSEPGAGTTLEVTIPVTSAAAGG